MVHKVDDYLIDKHFQPLGDWLANKTGRNVFRWALAFGWTGLSLEAFRVASDIVEDATSGMFWNTTFHVIFGFLGLFFLRFLCIKDAEENAKRLEQATEITTANDFRHKWIFLRWIFVSFLFLWTFFIITLPNYDFHRYHMFAIHFNFVLFFFFASCEGKPPVRTTKKQKGKMPGEFQGVYNGI